MKKMLLSTSEKGLRTLYGMPEFGKSLPEESSLNSNLFEEAPSAVILSTCIMHYKGVAFDYGYS